MSPTFSEKRAFVKKHKPRPGKPTPSFAWIWASMFCQTRACARPSAKMIDRDLEPLRRWLDAWDRVCDAADPDDGDLPPWTDVRKSTAPDFDPEAFPTAEFFSEYMRANLVYLVRDLLSSPHTEN